MIYKGNPVSRGIAVGAVFRHESFTPNISSKTITAEQVPAALTCYQEARESAKKELERIYAKVQQEDPQKAKIFTAHIDILFDVAMDEEIKEKITDDLFSVEWAVEKIFSKYIKILGRTKDERIRERVSDMNDVRIRLLRNCMGVPECNLAVLEKPVIVVANDLFPSDTASMDRHNVLAIVTEIGGSTSHTAIIARSYEIPALLGVADVMQNLITGNQVIVDAVDGYLLSEPTSADLYSYKKKAQEYTHKTAETRKYLNTKPVTADGTVIDLELNIGSASTQELEGAKYTDGVGLFRTEFLYMGKDKLPTEEEQYQIYHKVLTEFGDRPVTLRTLDIGGDKKLDCMQLPVEDNPFLGNRALRLCFTHMDIFKTQLRAALRAAVIGNLWIMFPMVGSLDDVRRAKAVVEEVKAELEAQGIPYGKNVKIGIMIEIPSIAMVADLVVQEVDFASIGTNDLCQYNTAVDRLNPEVASYYQSYHPAMFRLIRFVVDEFNKAGKPICVCGELGGDRLAMPVLLGMGMRKISMGFALVAECKKIITHLTTAKAKVLADTVCNMKTAGEIEAYLKAELADIL